MKHLSLNRAVLLIFFFLLAASAAQAGSIFSGNGLGEVVYAADARLRSMGGAGLALTRGLSGSLVNPALMGGLKVTALTVSSRPEALYVKDAQQENVLTSARIDNFALYLPLGKQFALSLDLRQQSDCRFKAYQITTVFDKVYTKAITRTGGTTLASVNLARRFGSSLYVGIRAGYVFGKLNQGLTGDFFDDDYLDTSVHSGIENTGSQLCAGLALKISRQFSVGAIFIPAYEVKQTETQYSSFSSATTVKRTLTNPLTFGFGLACYPSPKFLGQIDVTVSKWSNFKIDGQVAPGYTDVIRVAAGCEYRALKEGSASYFRKIPLRFGYTLEPWYLKTDDGEKIHGHFLTMGIGLPFGQQGAHLDASLELGMRGDISSVGAEEKIVRGTISIWGFERWFQRKK